MKSPSGSMFGQVPGAELKLERVAENSSGFMAAPLDDLTSFPVRVRKPSLTHLAPDNRLWLRQVWSGRNVSKDFAL